MSNPKIKFIVTPPPDATVENSDASYTNTVASGGTLVVPDINIEVNTVVEGQVPALKDVKILITDGVNPVTPDDVSVVGDTVTVEVPSGGAVMNVDFSADKVVADLGETITFTDLTDNSPTHWSWRFDNAGESIVQNPTFSFLTTGFKNITLLAGKVGAGGVEVKNSFIEILAALLLDAFPNAEVAYSLRKLRAAYTGSAIRVRRSSDNTEQDIGFNGSNGLDTTALLAFVGAGNGFVTTWYDQSGNGLNATQSTAGNQPQIVSSGVVLVENGKPSMSASGSQYLTVASSVSLFNFLHDGTSSSVFSVNKFGTSSNPNEGYSLFGNSQGASGDIGTIMFFDDRSSVPRNNALVQAVSRGVGGSFTAQQIVQDTITPNQQLILSQYFDADNATAANRLEAYVNNGSAIKINTLTNTPTSSNATFDMQIMAGGNNALPMKGTVQEIVYYPNQPTQADILTNINTYYNVF
jgi:PKD repeat protein